MGPFFLGAVMDADAINDSLENISNATSEQLSKFLTNYVLTTLLVSVTGFWGMLLKPIVGKIVDIAVSKLFEEATLSTQKQVDVVDGVIIIKAVNQAVEDHNEDDYIDAIGQY